MQNEKRMEGTFFVVSKAWSSLVKFLHQISSIKCYSYTLHRHLGSMQKWETWKMLQLGWNISRRISWILVSLKSLASLSVQWSYNFTPKILGNTRKKSHTQKNFKKLHWVIHLIKSAQGCLCNCAAWLPFLLLTVRTSQSAQWKSFLVMSEVPSVPDPKSWQVSV